MSRGRYITGWNLQLKGGLLGVRDRHLPFGEIGVGLHGAMKRGVFFDAALIGNFADRRNFFGSMVRLSWMPFGLRAPLDVAVTGTIDGGLQDAAPSVRSGVGAELAYTISPLGKGARIFAGVDVNFITAGRQHDWSVFSGVVFRFPPAAENKTAARSMPVEILPKNEAFDRPAPATQPVVGLQEQSRRKEEEGDYDGAFDLENKALDEKPEQSHARLFYLDIMRNYIEQKNISRERLYAINATRSLLIKRRRFDDISEGVRLFLEKSGQKLGELPQFANVNVLIVIADLIGLLAREDVKERGILDRKTFMSVLGRGYFAPSPNGEKMEPLPKIRDGLIWFARMYARGMNSEVKLAADVFKDFKIDLMRIFAEVEEDEANKSQEMKKDEDEQGE